MASSCLPAYEYVCTFPTCPASMLWLSAVHASALRQYFGCMHARARACTYTDAHTRAHTHTHTCTRTHAGTRARTLAQEEGRSCCQIMLQYQKHMRGHLHHLWMTPAELAAEAGSCRPASQPTCPAQPGARCPAEEPKDSQPPTRLVLRPSAEPPPPALPTPSKPQPQPTSCSGSSSCARDNQVDHSRLRISHAEASY